MNLQRSLRDLPIGVKVALAPGLVVICMVVLASVSLLSNRASGEAIASFTNGSLPAVSQALELKADVTKLSGDVMRSLAYEGAGMKAKQIEAIDLAVAKELKALLAKVAELEASSNAPFKARYGQVEAALQTYGRVAVETLDMKSGGLSTAAMMMNTVDGEYVKLSKQLDDLVADVTSSSMEQGNAATAENQRAELVSVVMLLVAVLMSVVATTLCLRLITRPLGRAVTVARQVADGDLRHSLDELGSDATGQVLAALDHVTGRLSGIMVDIRAVAEHIDEASREVAAGNLDLSGRTERAAAALQMTASTVEQLTSQMQVNSATATQASQLAGEAVAVARQGGGVVQEVVEAMDDIHHHAKRIGDIISVIDGIAFQTNILSLNAAVEAARAGEHGRGFAVVASEVRALAGRSSQAAKEIRGLIGASVERASAGASKVQAAGAIMIRIVGSIEELSGMVTQIAMANDEQAKGVAGVNQTVVEMDRNTQQNAALVEQASAATMSLQRQSERLLAAVAVFKT